MLSFFAPSSIKLNAFDFAAVIYTNTVKDQILPSPAPITVGGTSILQNVGSLSNHGLEVTVNVRPVETRDFRWDLIVNYAFNRGKVISLADGSDFLEHGYAGGNTGGTVQIRSRVGEQMGDILTYYPKTDAQGNHLINPDDGLYVIDYGDNWVKRGNSIPNGVGGLASSLAYKGFQLDFLIDVSIGGYICSTGYNYTMARGINPDALPYRDATNGGISYYFKDVNIGGTTVRADGLTQGPNGEQVFDNGIIIPGVLADSNRESTGTENNVIVSSDRYYNYVFNTGNSEPTFFNSVFENTYVKFRELSLSYSLPVSLTSKFACKNLTLSLFGRNLFYFHKNKSGYDVETTAGTNWNNQVFVGSETTASVRSFGIALRASF
jgi:hypothetical protein